jgi:hypothetical protein
MREFVICHLRMRYLSFLESRGFALGGPDRRAEDAGKLTIFLDELLDQYGRGHPSFQNDEEPEAGLIELFDGDSEFMYEVGTALRPSHFDVILGWRSARTCHGWRTAESGRSSRRILHLRRRVCWYRWCRMSGVSGRRTRPQPTSWSGLNSRHPESAVQRRTDSCRQKPILTSVPRMTPQRSGACWVR